MQDDGFGRCLWQFESWSGPRQGLEQLGNTLPRIVALHHKELSYAHSDLQIGLRQVRVPLRIYN